MYPSIRDVTAGAMLLTLFQPGGQILPQHCRGHTKNFLTVTSLSMLCNVHCTKIKIAHRRTKYNEFGYNFFIYFVGFFAGFFK